jgi:hypothetical protein
MEASFRKSSSSWLESRNQVAVSIEFVPTKTRQWFPMYRNAPAEAPAFEVDVRIQNENDEDAYAPQRVWWQMLRRVLREHTSFVYEPLLDTQRYFDHEGLPWAWSFVCPWPDRTGPSMALRTNEEFLARCDALSEDDWQTLLCSVLHGWNSTVLLHEGPLNQPLDDKLRPLWAVIMTEHEWDGGRFYFLSEEVTSPLEYVASLFHDALQAAPI